ncbi:TonB-dependent receptor [Lysobacter sp. CFH 32150]|uniref:TonB-dependent receptor n=1 Tax=Lysobacter sp. CFH 32150 TaxID=2927128 RepID=UPI001FA6BCC5|nr:TonB-dependent receptor [Lysobacter sp. CFH 32150]MCI4568679.1 TonB-dependent receptor [Lysobacter sp. CFH 32150]
MASKYLAKGLQRSALTVALGLCFAGGVHAQTTVGAVTGHATSGDTITVSNPATGFSRTITVGADGNYRFAQLPIGQYTVTRNGANPRNVTVNVGTAANVDYVTGAGAATLDTVTVVGTGAINPIDVSSVESTTILTAEQIAKIPVPRDTTSVALLAPGTVRGDAAFGNLASFGGASVAENAYYINGFNITNSFRNLNFSNVPFEAIAEQQIKTGGYGAEFGRSLGGVVNQITKRGTNEFHAGGNIFWSPEDLREDVKDVYLTNGTLRQDNSSDSTWNAVASVWASGALIKDRLFAYGLISYGRRESDTWGSIASLTNTSSEVETPTWLLKMDWNITDNHSLEFTAFSDQQDTETDVYANDAGVLNRKQFIGTNFGEQGGDNYILKYTGYLTDSFTLSALAGHGEFSRSQRLRTADGRDVQYTGDINSTATGCPVVVDARPGWRRDMTGVYGSACNITGGTIDRIDSGDERDQFRLDAEWQLGDHLLRFGYDLDDYTSKAGVALEGGYQWRYTTVNPDGIPDNEPGAPQDSFDRVRQQYFQQGATVEVQQRAFYIQDSWNITDNFIAYLGARWDSFENINGQGQTYVKIDDQFGPRLGFSWDVNGDSTFKVFGNAGRYALPLTPSVAVRGASASLFSRQTFNFDQTVDPVTGAPGGVTPRACPGPGCVVYLNGEDGLAKRAGSIASKNLDPMYQDEYILGMQMQLTDHFSLGVRGIFRDLKQAIDDNCDYTAILDANGFAYEDGVGFVNANGDVAALPSAGFPYCRMFNPGSDAVFETDLLGDGTITTNTIPGSRLSPQAKRTYSAMEFFFDGNWDKFFLQGSYTYAKSKGNTEGGVKSDIGQADTSVTQDFDYLELTVDTYGYLPNDRRHTLKLFGNYDITEEWAVGVNLLVQSGRPINCFGNLDQNPLPPEPVGVDVDGDGEPGELNYAQHNYGSSFMRCGTTALGGADDANVVRKPRGTSGRLPWTQNFDVNVAYRPSWAEGLQFKVDIFNVFNSQKVTSVNEVAEEAIDGQPSETYLVPLSFQAPRSVRFMVQYDF